MIIENRIIAGYGDLAVSSEWLIHKFTVEQMKLKQEIGLSLLDYNFESIGNEIEITLSYEDCLEFEKLLRDENYFEFKSYIFDFMKENSDGSKKVFKKAVRNILSSHLRVMAC